jgi:peptidoglycan/LPS O-acetylase OafA/YrhL
MATQQIRHQRPELDGIRGVACLIVLVLHCVGFSGIFPSIFGDGGMVGIPKVGVWLFFVLSAFLLTLKHLDGPFSIEALTDYSVSRFLRIVPIGLIPTLGARV